MITPLKHRVLVQKEEPKKETESGLFIPEAAQDNEKVVAGIVLAIGSEADKEIKIGDKVLFGKYDATPVEAQYCDGKERCGLIADNQIRVILT